MQARLLRHLSANGWDIMRVADTGARESGTDVIVRCHGRTMHIEVKGWPSIGYRDPTKADMKKPTHPSSQARVWFNDAVVHGLRLREQHPDDAVGLAFPDFKTYRSLAAGIAGSLQKCAIEVLLVDEAGECTGTTG